MAKAGHLAASLPQTFGWVHPECPTCGKEMTIWKAECQHTLGGAIEGEISFYCKEFCRNPDYITFSRDYRRIEPERVTATWLR